MGVGSWGEGPSLVLLGEELIEICEPIKAAQRLGHSMVAPQVIAVSM